MLDWWPRRRWSYWRRRLARYEGPTTSSWRVKTIPNFILLQNIIQELAFIWSWTWSPQQNEQPKLLKKNQKKFGLDQESNSGHCNDRKQRLVGHITTFHSDSKVRTLWNVEYEIINFVSPMLVSCSLSYLSHSFTQVKIHILSFYFLTSHAWMHSLLMLQRTEYCVCQ